MSDEEEESPNELTPAEAGGVAPRLTGDEFGRALIAHINEKAVAPNDGCQVCGSPNNSVQPTLYQVDVQAAEGAFASGQIIPLAATVCFNCGFVRFFNVPVVRQLMAGVVFPIEAQDEPDAS